MTNGTPAAGTDLFKRLVQDTDASIASLDAKTEADLNEHLDRFKKKFDEVEQIQDGKERDARVKVLEADFSKLRQGVREEESDLANAVLGLNAVLEQLGGEYQELQRLTPEEQELISEAEKNSKKPDRNWRKPKGNGSFSEEIGRWQRQTP